MRNSIFCKGWFSWCCYDTSIWSRHFIFSDDKILWKMAFTDNRPFRWAKIFPMDGLGPSVSKGKVFGETKYGYFVGFIVVSTASRYTTPIRHLKKKARSKSKDSRMWQNKFRKKIVCCTSSPYNYLNPLIENIKLYILSCNP